MNKLLFSTIAIGTIVSNTFAGADIEVSVSNFNAKSHEYVYDGTYSFDGRKISELVWEAKNVSLLGLGLKYSFFNNFALFANYKHNLSDTDGTMDDYDWLAVDPTVRTHWSHHDSTDVTKVELIDIGLKYILKFSENTLDVDFTLGYKQEKQDFKAYGGSFDYFGVKWTEPDSKLMITYKQQYKGPYLGASISKTVKNFNLNAGIRYSAWIKPEFSDTHHQRIPPFTISTDFDNAKMVTYNVGTSYKLNDNNIFSLDYEYTKYEQERGPYLRTDFIEPLANSLGIESKNNLLTFNYNYLF
ncbi:omptin family outer membrane protease [Sulfurimonas sp.]|uniref:omptin family outer membrane protease n=1 Tax=Sulfurimonas sp. TaxID=2022749 RepID=UPI00356A414C